MIQDNIYIQKRNNRYWVWLANASDTNPKPAKCDAKFYLSDDALNYAREWRKNVKSKCDIVTLNDL